MGSGHKGAFYRARGKSPRENTAAKGIAACQEPSTVSHDDTRVLDDSSNQKSFRDFELSQSAHFAQSCAKGIKAGRHTQRQ